MSIERPREGDVVSVRYSDDDTTGEIVGDVEYVGSFDGDFGVRVDTAEKALPVFARTYAPNVYTFDGASRTILGELEAIEVIEDE